MNERRHEPQETLINGTVLPSIASKGPGMPLSVEKVARNFFFAVA